MQCLCSAPPPWQWVTFGLYVTQHHGLTWHLLEGRGVQVESRDNEGALQGNAVLQSLKSGLVTPESQITHPGRNLPSIDRHTRTHTASCAPHSLCERLRDETRGQERFARPFYSLNLNSLTYKSNTVHRTITHGSIPEQNLQTKWKCSHLPFYSFACAE